jgi:ketosteroid isomerase-like protein
MSLENVELARRGFEAFNRAIAEGDPDLYGLLDPEVEWISIMTILEGTTYHGVEGVRHWIEDVRRDWTTFEARSEQFRDLGDDRVLVLGSWRAQGRGGEVLLDIPQAAWLLQMRKGKVVRMQTFTERKKAFEAAGVGE